MSKRAKYDPLTALRGDGVSSAETATVDLEADSPTMAVSKLEAGRPPRPARPTSRSRPGRTQLNVSISPEAKARLDGLMNGLPRSVTRADLIEHFILEHGDTAASHLRQTS